MSPRRNVFVALRCCCLVLSFMSIQAMNVPGTTVSKRDISDLFSYFDDLLYDSDSDEGKETVLTCRNCTVLVQPLPACVAAPGSTTNNVAPGTTAPASAAASPAAPNPAPVVPPASASTAPAAPSAAPAAQGPVPAVPPTAANPVPSVSPGAPSPSPSPTATAGTAAAAPAASNTAPAGSSAP